MEIIKTNQVYLRRFRKLMQPKPEVERKKLNLIKGRAGGNTRALFDPKISWGQARDPAGPQVTFMLMSHGRKCLKIPPLPRTHAAARGRPSFNEHKVSIRSILIILGNEQGYNNITIQLKLARTRRIRVHQKTCYTFPVLLLAWSQTSCKVLS